MDYRIPSMIAAVFVRHVPPHSLEELIRVAMIDSPIIFSMRDDPLQEPEYPAMLKKLENEGKWEPILRGVSFHSMPYSEPEITHRIHVYKVCRYYIVQLMPANKALLPDKKTDCQTALRFYLSLKQGVEGYIGRYT